jgi:chitodextrinase
MSVQSARVRPSVVKLGIIGVLCALMSMSALFVPARAYAAACAPPAANLGVATATISVPAAAKYRIWSRIMSLSTAGNSYLLEIDGSQCFVVGGKSLPANAWTWVDYQNGNVASKIELQMSKGSHKVKFIGRQADVQFDRLVVASDLSCIPAASGDNCNAPHDSVPPMVDLATPTEHATVSRLVTVTATATDDVALKKVEFFANGELQTTDTNLPYGFTWDSAEVPNGSVALTTKAYDAAGNVSTDTHTVVVKNDDMQSPTAPANLSATATAPTVVSLSWQAATDDQSVAGYAIMRNGLPLKSISAATSYQDTTVLSNASYTYQLTAFDGVHNVSAASPKVQVKTPSAPDAQAPSTPQQLKAVVAQNGQVNLSWQPSTDDQAVATYELYRKSNNAALTRIGEIAATSLGDARVDARTKYYYYVVAKDAAGNRSAPSNTVTATTPPSVGAGQGIIRGKVSSSKSRKPTVAHVVVLAGGTKRTYTTSRKGEYAIRGLTPGSYNVTYSKSTYHSQTLTVKARNGVVWHDVMLRQR